MKPILLATIALTDATRNLADTPADDDMLPPHSVVTIIFENYL